MHQVLPLPHTSVFHPKYSSKYLEDELTTTKLPDGFSSASASLLQIKARSRQAREQSQCNKKQNPRAQKLLKPKGCGYLLTFPATTLAYKEKSTQGALFLTSCCSEVTDGGFITVCRQARAHHAAKARHRSQQLHMEKERWQNAA